jgi:hypothetical protein
MPGKSRILNIFKPGSRINIEIFYNSQIIINLENIIKTIN